MESESLLTENDRTVLFAEDSINPPPELLIACARLRLKVVHAQIPLNLADKTLFARRSALVLSIRSHDYQWALDLRKRLARLSPDSPRFIFSYQRLPGSVVVDFISRGFRRLPPAASADQIHEAMETVMAAESRNLRKGLLFEKDAATHLVNLVGEDGPMPFNAGEGEIRLIWTTLARNAGQVCTLQELALAAQCSLKEVNSYICRLRFRYERMRRALGTKITAKDLIQTREDGYLLNARQRK